MISDTAPDWDWADRYLDFVDDLVIMLEAGTGVVTSANEAATRRLLPVGHQLAGSYVMKLVFRDDRQLVANALAALSQTGDCELTLRLNEPTGTRSSTSTYDSCPMTLLSWFAAKAPNSSSARIAWLISSNSSS